MPKITLFAFHLYRENSEKIAADAELLWQQLAPLAKIFAIPILTVIAPIIARHQENKSGKYSLKSGYFNSILPETVLSYHGKVDGHPLKCALYPVEFSDSYGLDLTIIDNSTDGDIGQLNRLNPGGCLLPGKIQSNLGQTLLLFIKPPSPLTTPEDAKTFADKCFQAITGLDNSQFICHSGLLLGSEIFAYDNGETDPQQHHHVIIWLDNHPDTSQQEKAGRYYNPLLYLLYCQSKILFHSWQSRRCYHEARKLYEPLDAKAKEFPTILKETRLQRLEKLKTWLSEISTAGFNYARYLRDMQDHQTSITTHRSNYLSSLANLQKYALPGDNLEFLAKFVQENCAYYQRQLETDLNYLQPGMDLFKTMVETIRGFVDIDAEELQIQSEKDERQQDRRLQNTISQLGSGLGAAGIAATASPYLIKQNALPPSDPKFKSDTLTPLGYSLLFSLVCGLVVWVITGVFICLGSRGDKSIDN
ncbi:MAG TPA: hypothetical protein IGS52_00920 [Oscillatoriaceae cyanobacterium M33_DOE_052]|nr:hypothetical protein [Oscillatoriaceae cyanobacterium M33_DOE_052]